MKNYNEDIEFYTDSDGNIRLSIIHYQQLHKQIKKHTDRVDNLTDEYIKSMPLLSVSIAAALANMHPQTVRQYDRLGLVSPNRSKGKSRRYSLKDVERLLNIQRLSREGVNLEGIRRIVELEEERQMLLDKIEFLENQLNDEERVFVADPNGFIYSSYETYDYKLDNSDGNSFELVLWKPNKSK